MALGASGGDAAAPVQPPASAPDAAADPVPADFLTRLRGQYVPEEAATPGISDNDKVRRYQAILREGQWAESRHAGAANLYQVRELMMAAAKGLTALEGSDQAHTQVMDIAHRLADSDAPPDSRVLADVLITRARVGQLAREPEVAIRDIRMFVARYAQTPADYKALMFGAGLYRTANADRMRRDCLQELTQKHLQIPGVSDFLQAEGLSPYLGRPVVEKLTLLDGARLSLPRDTLGKVTMLHFWTMDKPGIGPRDAELIKAAYENYRPAGLEILGVNLDADRAKVSEFVDAKGLVWMNACSGLAMNDPTFRRYRTPLLPCYWLINPYGQAVSNSEDSGPGYITFHGFQSWAAIGEIDRCHETIACAPYYRSGEFLLDLPAVCSAPAAAKGDVPADAVQAIREKVFLPPSLGLSADKKADLFRQVLELGQSAEKEYPAAPNLTLVRNWMLVAARWLATETRAPVAAKQALEIASRVRAATARGDARLLADYVAAAGDLAADQPAPEKVAQRIDAFVQSYAAGEVPWAADILGVVLALECGDEASRLPLLRRLYQEFLASQPKVRGFLREFCRIGVDARSWDSHSGLLFSVPTTQPGRFRRLSVQPRTIAATLPCLDGRTLRLPDDMKGKVVVMHFWSLACPPDVAPHPLDNRPRPPTPGELSPDPAYDIVVVGVNLDRSRADVEAYLKDKHKDWIHGFSGKGWDDPLARELDIYSLPRSVVIDREGKIYCWGRPGRLSGQIDAAADVPYKVRQGLLPRGTVVTETSTDRRGRPITPRPATSAPDEVVATSQPESHASSQPAEVYSAWPFDSQEAGRRQEETAKALGMPRELTFHLLPANEFPIKFVLMPAGKFQMGSPKTEKDRQADEGPQHEVTISKPFYMGMYHVTQAQFFNVTGRKISGFQGPAFNPVENATWDDALEFCQKLSERMERKVRLPTEAEWEYACRAGTATALNTGDTIHPDEANFDGDSVNGNGQKDEWRQRPTPVGTFKPNAFGLYDMHGNVWQWCSDWYGEKYYATSPRVDPPGPDSGEYRVQRGGSWRSCPKLCRSAYRFWNLPVIRENYCGFRVAVTVD